MTTKPAGNGEPDFSLVLGGPLFHLFRRTHLSGNALELLQRRVAAIVCLVWAPLLPLSIFSGHAWGGSVAIPFLSDIEMHVRLLIALPLLIAAELVVHQRLQPLVKQFLERHIIIPEEVPRFNAALQSALRLRNSVAAELVLAVLVYTLGLWVWRHQVALATTSWYAMPQGTDLHLTPAGIWLAFVSMPVFQFILLRWYFRLFLWFWFLFKVSRLNLRLIPIHPDKTAGLGFLGASFEAFAPVLLAQGVLLAGLMASQIFYAGKSFLDFKVQMLGFLTFFILAMLIPLTVFTPALARAKRLGRREFGTLASRYAGDFQDKWVKKNAPSGEPLLGSADIQSLADLGNSYSFVQEMRLVPFGAKDVAQLAFITAFPFLPLALTTFSLEQLADHIIKIIF